MIALFASVLLSSAALGFVLQPMIAKMLLPSLGGTPAVWNTCMLFFQASLLAGYAWVHAIARLPRLRAQLAVHAALLAASALALPIAVRSPSPVPSGGSPVPWLLGTLVLSAFLPFAAASTTGPLLQRWFAATDDRRAGDPYFLYVASNLGSFAGLLAYPLAIERRLPLRGSGASGWTQSTAWSAAYVAFALGTLACGIAAARRAAPPRAPLLPARGPAALPSGRVARWAFLAFVPSSLLLGTTQAITTDVAAVPLLWVVPLALYLATFVAAFARRRPAGLVRASGVALAVAVAATGSLTVLGETSSAAAEILVRLVALTAAGLVAHGRLADDRPPSESLTAFYLAMAAGGALGGAFNALVAPVLFTDLWEYPLALALACFLRSGSPAEAARGSRRSLAVDAGVAAAIAVALSGVVAGADRLASLSPVSRAWMVTVAPALLVLAAVRSRTRSALVCAAWLAIAWYRADAGSEILDRDRNFFGVHRVVRFDGPRFTTNATGGLVFSIPYRVLESGATRHGMQALDPRYARFATSYYHRTGPAGQVFDVLRARNAPLDVALIGLGAGTLASYGRSGDRFAVFEIDDAVVHVARDSGMFTFLRDSRAAIDYRIGDGRLGISKAPEGAFDLVVLDAFSSDAIPVHLLTVEALRTYLGKLRPGGLLALHLSNRFVDLAPVVDAASSALGVRGGVRKDRVDPADPSQTIEAKDDSTWAVLARAPEGYGPFESDSRWAPLPSRPGPPDPARLWTDDDSDIVSALRFF